VPRFVEDVVPILREKCATCHVTGGPGAFAMFDAAGTPQYQVIHDHMGAMLSAIDAKRMPPNGTTVSAAQVAMLRAWQAVGAPPEPTATPTPPPPGQPLPSTLPTGTPVPGLQTISFNQHVVPILQNHCANCHGFGGSGSGQLLMFGATRRAVHGQISVRINDIISSIEAGRMPPLVAPGTVTTDEINTLKLWAAAGAPNN
jgi:mono/diheme cytochrome c family protein